MWDQQTKQNRFLNTRRVYRGLLVIWSFFKGNPTESNTFHPFPCIHFLWTDLVTLYTLHYIQSFQQLYKLFKSRSSGESDIFNLKHRINLDWISQTFYRDHHSNWICVLIAIQRSLCWLLSYFKANKIKIDQLVYLYVTFSETVIWITCYYLIRLTNAYEIILLSSKISKRNEHS